MSCATNAVEDQGKLAVSSSAQSCTFLKEAAAVSKPAEGVQHLRTGSGPQIAKELCLSQKMAERRS